jgi:hypothetical protein
MKIRTNVSAAVTSLVLAAALAGCTGESDSGSSSGATPGSGAAAAGSAGGNQAAAQVLAANKADHAEDGDAEFDAAKAVDVKLTGTSATAGGDGVKADGATVTITAAGTYRLSGTLNGQVVVNAPDATVKLVLDGATISSTTTAAIGIAEGEEVVVILADGSTNTLSDAGSYADGAEINAALYSAADLTITGTGALTVRGNGNDAIAGQDGLVIQSGTITVEAADDGIRGKDYLVVEGGTVTVTSGGDGLKADNAEAAGSGYISVADGTVTVTAKGDGADAATDLVVTGGKLTVATGGGSGVRPVDDASTKGLKSKVITVLEGGTVDVDSSDDAVHSDGAVHLNGATVTVASGDDGVHAETTLLVDAGTVKVTSAVEGLESADITVNGGSTDITASDDGVNAAGGTGEAQAGGGPGGGGQGVGDYQLVVTGGTLIVRATTDGLDSNGTATFSGGTVVLYGATSRGSGALDLNGSLTINGGTIAAVGSAVTPSEQSGQGWLSAAAESPVAAGTTLHVVDGDDKVVTTFVTAREVQVVTFSSASIKNGEEYKIYAGGTAGGDNVGGLTAAGKLGSATQIATATAGEAGAGGMGGPGGGRPRR